MSSQTETEKRETNKTYLSASWCLLLSIGPLLVLVFTFTSPIFKATPVLFSPKEYDIQLPTR